MVFFDVACDRVLERLKLKNLKYSQRKALAQLSWQMVSVFFEIQPTLSGSFYLIAILALRVKSRSLQDLTGKKCAP